MVDEATGRTFFRNTNTGDVQWDRPDAADTPRTAGLKLIADEMSALASVEEGNDEFGDNEVELLDEEGSDNSEAEPQDAAHLTARLAAARNRRRSKDPRNLIRTSSVVLQGGWVEYKDEQGQQLWINRVTGKEQVTMP